MMHCIPTTTTVTAEQLADIFFREIVRLHGIPCSIISDRDSRFTSAFWSELWKKFGTTLAMTTAYRAQADGQTERCNRIIEDILRAFVNHKQNDWDRHLTAVEIVYNNTKQSSTGFSPYFLNYGQHPQLPLPLTLTLHQSQSQSRAPSPNSDSASDSSSASSPGPTSSIPVSVEKLLEDLHDSLQVAHSQVVKSQLQQQQQANKHRLHYEFEVGDKVWLSSADLPVVSTSSRTPKLSPRFVGPFVISEKLSPLVYKLKLPPLLSRIHPVFHISKLRPHHTNTTFQQYRQQQRQTQTTQQHHSSTTTGPISLSPPSSSFSSSSFPDPSIVPMSGPSPSPPLVPLDVPLSDNFVRPPSTLSDQYEVEAIRKHRRRKWSGDNKTYTQYLVKWKGYPEWENTWEWEDNLQQAPDILKQYKKNLQTK